MTNHIEKIIAEQVNPWPGGSRWNADTDCVGDTYIKARAIVAALKAAGLKILPEQITPEMAKACRDHEEDPHVAMGRAMEVWSDCVEAFDPDSFVPKKVD